MRLGHPITQFGAAFFFFGLVFVRIFLPATDLSAGLSDDTVRKMAQVVGVDRTNFAQGKQSSIPIWQIRYAYDVDELPYEAESFVPSRRAPSVGESIAIDYERNAPHESLAVGGQARPFGPATLFVLIFPLIGGILLLVMWRRAGRRIRLLRHGVLSNALIKSREPTNVRVNERPVYRIDLEFVDQAGIARSASTRTHLTERLDREVEPLLYAPDKPTETQLLDTLPPIAIAEDGRLQVFGRVPVVLLTLIPGLGVLGHLAWWLA